MGPIKVTHMESYGEADIFADYLNGGYVRMWFKYLKSGIEEQERHVITFSPEEWDRLVAYVDWRRKDGALEDKKSS